MKPVPPELLHRPFSREEAAAAGVTSRMLQSKNYVRVFPRVWRASSHVMTEDDTVAAARMTLPPHARLTGISAIQRLGLDFGPVRPLRFVVVGDLHLVPPEIFVHRTKVMPPCTEGDVTPAAAFIAYCRQARVLNAIKVGDWLLNRGHMDLEELTTLALAQPWRDGASEALWIAPLLDGRSRSLPESETRAVLVFAGLPRPLVNVPLPVVGVLLIGDLVFEAQRAVVEYEGAHHQEDRGQYVSDVDRYAILRGADVAYLQVTKEKLRQRRRLVGEVHQLLVSRGFCGPPPSWGDRWRQLDVRLSALSPTPLTRRSAVS